MSGDLQIIPITFREAVEFIGEWHRHHPKATGHKFSIGLARRHELVGCAIVGRPVARCYDDERTLEVNRTCVADDVPNGNSMLYAAAWRAAKALGYRRLITYTQEGESGSSLRGAGWRVVAERPARDGLGWASRGMQRKHADGVARTLWEAS